VRACVTLCSCSMCCSYSCSFSFALETPCVHGDPSRCPGSPRPWRARLPLPPLARLPGNPVPGSFVARHLLPLKSPRRVRRRSAPSSSSRTFANGMTRHRARDRSSVSSRRTCVVSRHSSSPKIVTAFFCFPPFRRSSCRSRQVRGYFYAFRRPRRRCGG
jgi:hypothetical protein